MLSEGRKRDAAANAVLALSFAANAAQSPQSLVGSGHIEAPGVAGMQRLMDPRKKRKDLDLQRVSHSARNKKMKTFREFLEEAHLNEMRKEDKVKGEKKTPLYKEVGGGRVERQPEGSDTKWRVRKSEKKGLSPRAATGRMKQGMKDPTNPYSGGIDMPGATRHAHGGGGSGAKAPGKLRGVGKLEKQKMEKTPEGERVRPFSAGPSPADKVALRRAKAARSVGGGDR